MDEYIDREAAIKAIEFNKGVGCSDRCVQGIKYIPAADVVEVVRCKDCDLWNEGDSAGWDDFGNNVCACTYFSNEDGYTVYTEPHDYCSKGERKEGEG